MTRVNVYRYDSGNFGELGHIDGWFTPEECVALVEANVLSDAEFERAHRKGPVRPLIETLYRTPEGRWVLQTAPRGSFEGKAPKRHEFLTDDQALEWLTRQGYESRIAEFFGELPNESGPGRPEIGGRVQVRLGSLLTEVDAYAKRRDITRAEAVRVLVAAGLDRDA
jgi:hypothetical protein